MLERLHDFVSFIGWGMSSSFESIFESIYGPGYIYGGKCASDRVKQNVCQAIPGKRPRGIGFVSDDSRTCVAGELANTAHMMIVAILNVIAEMPACKNASGIVVGKSQ